MKGIFSAFGIALALGPCSARAIEVIDRTEYYEVRGNTADGLARDMAAKGPQHPTGRRAWGYTDWRVNSTYVLVPRDRGCELGDVRVQLTVVTTLPRWVPSGVPAHPRLKRDWTRLLARIAEHEDTHRAHGLEAAALAEQRIASIPLQKDCATAEKSARRALRVSVLELTAVSRAFDRETDFGRRQGVGLR